MDLQPKLATAKTNVSWSSHGEYEVAVATYKKSREAMCKPVWITQKDWKKEGKKNYLLNGVSVFFLS